MKKFAVYLIWTGVIIDSNPAQKTIVQFYDKYDKHLLSDEEMKRYIWGRTNKEWIRHLFGENLPDDQLRVYADEKSFVSDDL